jgi:hypothetical protein
MLLLYGWFVLLLYRDPVSDCRPDCIVVMCRLRLKKAACRGWNAGGETPQQSI